MDHYGNDTGAPSGSNRWMTPLGSDGLTRYPTPAYAASEPEPMRYAPNELAPGEPEPPVRPLQPVFPDWGRQAIKQATTARTTQQMDAPPAPREGQTAQTWAPYPAQQPAPDREPAPDAAQSMLSPDPAAQPRRRSRLVERDMPPVAAEQSAPARQLAGGNAVEVQLGRAEQSARARQPAAPAQGFSQVAAPSPAIFRSAANAQPEPPMAPAEPSPIPFDASAYATPAFAPQPDDDEDEADAMPTDAMATPVPVPVEPFALPPKKKRAWLWGMMVALVLLAAAALALWKTGALSSLLGLSLPPAPDFIPAIFPAAQTQTVAPSVAPTDAIEMAISENAPLVDSLTADSFAASAPATITFRIHTNASAMDVKLLAADGSTPQVVGMDSAKDSAGVLWVVQLRFTKPYSDVIRVYARDQNGEWRNSDASCRIEIV